MEAKGEVLVAFLPNKSDFGILREKGWYRIPVTSKPKRWPPKYLAFYQPRAFDDDAYKIRYFGLVNDIDIVSRKEIFPNEIESERSQKQYYRFWVKKLEEREHPIPSRFPRKIVFIPTSWEKFMDAEQLNDLFDDSPLEDLLWRELKTLQISAERQWEVKTEDFFYQLDFAFFCNKGNLDVETDGDTWHLQPDRVKMDNRRNNDLASLGWQVLRFNTQAINEQRTDYCIPHIQKTINKLGGLIDDGFVSRKFYPNADNAQQLSLFENKGKYMVDDSQPDLD